MDVQAKGKALGRLRRIEGQVQGIQRMVEEDKYCVDILLQLTAVQGAVEQVQKLLLGQHLETCVADAVSSGSSRDRQRKLDELLEVFSRFSGREGARVIRRTSDAPRLDLPVRLHRVVPAIELARRTMRIVKENLGWAFGYNLVLVPVAAGMLYPVWGIQLSPILAGLAMALSSRSVVANSLRLRRFRPIAWGRE